MDFSSLDEDRFLRKDPNQKDQTKDATYAAGNPAPKRGDDSFRKSGRPKGSEEDDGAPNILTGTVIVSCFIQTSALPSRIELQGNDLTFFDDTTEKNGVVIGDTSRLIFTHASGKSGEVVSQGFVWEKRASIKDTYDNVLSLYAYPPKQGRQNYLYFGLDGRGTEFNTNYMAFLVNHDTNATSLASANGAFVISGVTNSGALTAENFGVIYNSILGLPGDGYSVVLAPTIGTGFVVIGEAVTPLIAGIDFGDAGNKFGTFYGTVSACPLPTVENALEILDRIPEPTFVGRRGHFGDDRKYFDDLTFPEEVLYTNSKGNVDLEHTHLLGFMLKAIIELKAEVDLLKSQR